MINVTDEFNLDQLPTFCPERQVFVADVSMLMQEIKCDLAGIDILECADLPEFLFHELGVRIPQQIDQIGIDVIDGAGPCVQDEYAVLGGREQAAVANF